MKDYVAEHPELRNLFYPVPHRDGYAGIAANFVLHVSDLMNGKTRLKRVPASAQVSRRRGVAVASLQARVARVVYFNNSTGFAGRRRRANERQLRTRGNRLDAEVQIQRDQPPLRTVWMFNCTIC